MCRIVSSCLQLLVHDMETACTAAFNAMVKVGWHGDGDAIHWHFLGIHKYSRLSHSQIPWQNVDSVGDSSQYVSTIAAHIRNTVPLLRGTMTSARKYFVNFCHKLAK